MATGFYHPSRGYWETPNDPPQRYRDAYPSGTVEVPLRPSSGHTWDGSAWVAPDPADILADKRAAATMTRDEFLIVCADAGIITDEVADEASTGAWPAAFNTFLSGLTRDQRIKAKAAWADAREVRRNSPILAQIAADQKVSEAQLDALYGIS